MRSDWWSPKHRLYEKMWPITPLNQNCLSIWLADSLRLFYSDKICSSILLENTSFTAIRMDTSLHRWKQLLLWNRFIWNSLINYSINISIMMQSCWKISGKYPSSQKRPAIQTVKMYINQICPSSSHSSKKSRCFHFSEFIKIFLDFFQQFRQETIPDWAWLCSGTCFHSSYQHSLSIQLN